MRIVTRLYDGIILGLAALGGLSLGFITLAIVVDVLLRNIVGRPMIWTSTVVEYVLLFATMAGSPWLVRTGGHVAITTFVDMLPQRLIALTGRAVIVACIAIAALIAWRALAIAVDEARINSMDIRSISIPGWVAYAMIGGGMVLVVTELIRLLASGAIRAGLGEGQQ